MPFKLSWPGGNWSGQLRFRFQPARTVRAAVLQAVDGHLSGASSSALGLRAAQTCPDPAGFYHAATRTREWFIRVSDRWGHPALEKALSDHLREHSVRTSRVLGAGLPLEWKGRRLRVDLRHFIRTRLFNGTSTDLQRAARLLRCFHQALKTFPEKQAVRRNAREWYDRLGATLHSIQEWVRHPGRKVFAERNAWAKRHRPWIRVLAENSDPRLAALPGAQCIHGDLNPGNVLFTLPQGHPLFCDFEESVQHFAPVAWDLAYFIQRFCLSDNPPPKIFEQRLQTVRAAYGNLPGNLAGMMRQAAWFAILYHTEARISRNMLAPLAELDKFVTLEQQAQRYQALL